MHRRDATLGLLASLAMNACGGSKSSPLPAAPTLYPQTVDEKAAGIEPLDVSAPPGAWRRYGADPSGNADSTAAINIASSLNAISFDDVGGRYRVAAPIAIIRSCNIAGRRGRTRIIVANPDASVFIVSHQSSVVIEQIQFEVLVPSSIPYNSPVVFDRATRCICQDCEFSGCSWAGVYLNDAADCVVRRCYFHDFMGAIQGSADVILYGNSTGNFVMNNRCLGGNYHGVLLEDPYSGALPRNNLIAENTIAGMQAYGVCLYFPSAGDTFNVIRDNHITDIRGSAYGGASGPGVYLAGLGAGGTRIEGNTLLRCCLETSRRTESPGAIGIHGMTAANAPISITGNRIDDMTAFDGILVAVSDCAVSVAKNRVNLNAGNISGSPIRIESASNVTVQDNILSRPRREGRCIYVWANGALSAGIAVTGNHCTGGNSHQIDFAPANGGHFEHVICTNNVCDGGGSSIEAVCISLTEVDSAKVSGNRCTAAVATALLLTDATRLMISQNEFFSNGPASVTVEGNCAGTEYRADNRQSGQIWVTGTGFERT